MKQVLMNALESIVMATIGRLCWAMMTEADRWQEVRWAFGPRRGGDWYVYRSVVDKKHRMISI